MREVGRCVALFTAVLVMSAGLVTCFGYASAFLDGVELGVADLRLLGFAILGAILMLFAMWLAYLNADEC